MPEDTLITREERGNVSVLTMVYRPYNLLGPTLIGAIATEVTAAHQAASRAIILRSGLRHFSAGADGEHEPDYSFPGHCLRSRIIAAVEVIPRPKAIASFWESSETH